MGDTRLGQTDLQAAAQGDTAGSFVGQFTVQYTRDTFHLLPQPLFRYLDPPDPWLQFQFATDWSWQLQFGWTLLRRRWDVLGPRIGSSRQQAVSRQFGQDSKQSAWIFNLAQGRAQTPVKSFKVYLFLQGAFYGQRDDDGSGGAGLHGTLGFGWQREAIFSRGHHQATASRTAARRPAPRPVPAR